MVGLYLILPALLVGCFPLDDDDDDSGRCLPNEHCSPKTPSGLSFTTPRLFGVDELSREEFPVAIGGTMEIALGLPESPSPRPFALPYEAIIDGPVAVRATRGPVVTLTGVQSGATLLRITDPEDGALFARRRVQSAPVIDVAVSTELSRGETAAVRPIAFVVGTQRIGVALKGELHRVIDTSMKLALDGATQTSWDTLTASISTPGVRTLTVTRGTEAPRTFEVPFVDHADYLALFYEAPTTYGSRGDTELYCFYPVFDGHYVVARASDWSFSADTGMIKDLSFSLPGCVEVTPSELGVLHLTATALGVTKTLAINVDW
jgi:hypothetical protein